MKAQESPSELEASQTSPASEHGSDKRRSTRLVLALPIKVKGVDALREAFVEQTQTVMVSCHGCKFQSKHYVPKGSTITLEIPRGGPKRPPRTVVAKVVWVQRPSNTEGILHIGVDFEAAGNVWDIPTPPIDWFPPLGEPEFVAEEQLITPVIPATPPPAPVAPVMLTASWDASELLVMASRAEGREAELAAALQAVKSEAVSALDAKTATPKHADPQFHEAVEHAVKAAFESFSESALEKLLARVEERMSAIVEEARGLLRQSAEKSHAKTEPTAGTAVSKRRRVERRTGERRKTKR
jgi:hypothetical protein